MKTNIGLRKVCLRIILMIDTASLQLSYDFGEIIHALTD